MVEEVLMTPHPDSLAAMMGPESDDASSEDYERSDFCVMMFSPYGRDRRRGDAMAAAAHEANRLGGER